MVATWAVVRWRLGRRNRVTPDRPSNAPLSWLWSGSRAARLHRRLQRAVATAWLRPGGQRRRRRQDASELDQLAAAVGAQAAGIDHLLVVAAGARGRARHAALSAAEAQVVQVEQLARRVAVLASQHQPGLESRSLAQVRERIEALESARADLARIEAALRDPAIAAGLPASPDRRAG